MAEIRMLGVHAYKGVDVARQGHRGNYFCVARDGVAKPCVVGGIDNVNRIKRILPEHRGRIEDMIRTVGAARLAQAMVGVEHAGWFGLVSAPKGGIDPLPEHRPMVSPRDLKALYFSYSHEGKIYVLTYGALDEEFFVGPAVLAHACQSFFRQIFPFDQPGQSVFGRADLYLDESPAIRFVMGYSRKMAGLTARRIKRFLPDQKGLVRNFESLAIRSNLESREVLEHASSPFNTRPIGVKMLGEFVHPETRRKKKMWGIELNPTEAYQYLSRFMMLMVDAFPRLFTCDLPGVSLGITALYLKKGAEPEVRQFNYDDLGPEPRPESH